MNKKNYALRYTAKQPVEQIYSSDTRQIQPLTYRSSLSVMVWNIYKQQRENWLPVLKEYAGKSDLILLQEAQTTPELVEFATTHYLVADQAPALSLQSGSAGVMTFSSSEPVSCCPLYHLEPWLRVPKSSLITHYPLDESHLLMVINIHAINFSLKLEHYEEQMNAIRALLANHVGPVIFAGDFNTWNKKRLRFLYRFAYSQGLQEVKFAEDRRIRVFGLPLDFLFYRGLELENATVIHTVASDHNPLWAQFKLLKV